MGIKAPFLAGSNRSVNHQCERHPLEYQTLVHTDLRGVHAEDQTCVVCFLSFALQFRALGVQPCFVCL